MKYYTCKYCFNEFEPTRRRVQKYCSNTCRSKAYHERQTANPQNKLEILEAQDLSDSPTKTKIQSMSLPGIGNAATGSILADSIKSVLTSEENKPATKKDLKNLTEKILDRYHIINNLPPQNGNSPYYDLLNNMVVYLRFPPLGKL